MEELYGRCFFRWGEYCNPSWHRFLAWLAVFRSEVLVVEG